MTDEDLARKGWAKLENGTYLNVCPEMNGNPTRKDTIVFYSIVAVIGLVGLAFLAAG